MVVQSVLPVIDHLGNKTLERNTSVPHSLIFTFKVQCIVDMS